MTTDRFGWLRILAYLCLLFLGMLSVSAQGQTHTFCPTDGVCTYSKAQTMSGGLKTSPFNTLLGYGCAHDGTDASSCLNTAMAAAAGTTLWLEPGYTYTHASTIVVPGGAVILAAGNVDATAGVAAFNYTGTGTAWNVSSTTTAWVYANRLSGFRIYSSAGLAATCLNLDRVAEFEMDHMTIGGVTGNGCAIGVNIGGISSGSVHDNRITWNTKAMIIDGYAAGTSFGATSSASNDFFNNTFFECSNGIQLKNSWSTTFRRNYFEACDNWFYINAADGTMDSNSISIVNVDIAYNKGTKGGDVAHVTPHPLRVTGAGTLGINTRDFTMHGNLWDTGGVDNAILIDSTTAGSVNIVLKSYENRFNGANNVYVSASKLLNLTDNGNTYAGPDGLTQSTPIYSGGGIALNPQSLSGLTITSTRPIGFSSSGVLTPDTGLSRGAAAQVNVGNGTAGDASGTIAAASVKIGSNTGAQLVASGTSTFTTTAVGAGACQTTVTTAATNALTTDTISWAYATAPTAATDGMLHIQPYLTAGNVNFMRCNSSAGSITPTALVINWKVIR